MALLKFPGIPDADKLENLDDIKKYLIDLSFQISSQFKDIEKRVNYPDTLEVSRNIYVESPSGGANPLEVFVDTGHADGLRRRLAVENNPAQALVDIDVRNAVLNIGDSDALVSAIGSQLNLLCPVGDTSTAITIYKPGEGSGGIYSLFFTRLGQIGSHAFGLTSPYFSVDQWGDTTKRFSIFEKSPSVEIAWGEGGVAELDTNLYRSAANTLKTDDRFVSAGGMSALSLPAHANNAAALAGGLVVGDFYRTGGDPDLVCVVH